MVLRWCSTTGGENYKYLGLTFSTGHSFSAAMEDTSIRAHAQKSTLEVLRTLKKINCNSAEVFFKPFNAQIVPMSMCTFLLVRIFCMCVIRLQMMFSEN